MDSEAHGVGVPAQVETPVLQVQPLTAWHVLLAVLLSQPAGEPVHEAVLDHVQLLADRQVVLEVLVEQAAAVPAQLPLAVFQVHPRSAAHMVLVVLLAHAVGVPLQSKVALLQVHPGCAVQVVMLALSAHAPGVPRQLAWVLAVQVQPVCAAQEVALGCELQVYAVPRQVPALVGQLQPGSAAQVVDVVFAPHDRGVPLHVPALGELTWQPGSEAQVDVDREAQDAALGVPAQCGPMEKVCVRPGSRVRADLQQSWPRQSLLTLQVFAHDLLHWPLQHTSPDVVLQSVDCAHALGQAA